MKIKKRDFKSQRFKRFEINFIIFLGIFVYMQNVHEIIYFFLKK